MVKSFDRYEVNRRSIVFLGRACYNLEKMLREAMMCKYRTLKQLLYLASFFICAGVIASLTLVLKVLLLCGCFRHQAKSDTPACGPISADARLIPVSR